LAIFSKEVFSKKEFEFFLLITMMKASILLNLLTDSDCYFYLVHASKLTKKLTPSSKGGVFLFLEL
tara:strand:- start:1671 stop:1868 length:198 start_codon:yes stop_codon:yes gene_type:complete